MIAVRAGGPAAEAPQAPAPVGSLPATGGSTGAALLALVLIGAGFGGRRMLRR